MLFAVVCGLWLLVGASEALAAPMAVDSRQGGAAGAPQEPTGKAAESDDERRPPDSAAAARRLASRELTLGGMFMGNIHLPNSRPLPDSTPTHEEMKAVATPPEFRSPPAVSFGWSWRGRGR
jgi:hypothetical protein